MGGAWATCRGRGHVPVGVAPCWWAGRGPRAGGRGVGAVPVPVGRAWGTPCRWAGPGLRAPEPTSGRQGSRVRQEGARLPAAGASLQSPLCCVRPRSLGAMLLSLRLGADVEEAGEAAEPLGLSLFSSDEPRSPPLDTLWSGGRARWSSSQGAEAAPRAGRWPQCVGAGRARLRAGGGPAKPAVAPQTPPQQQWAVSSCGEISRSGLGPLRKERRGCLCDSC